MTTYFGTILWEIACIRVRQRRILKTLKDKNILDWDGSISASDKEAQAILEELQKNFDTSNSGQVNSSPNA